MATTYSTQMTNHRATPQVINTQGGGLYRIPWSYTIAGADLVENDVIEVCRVPAGCKVLMPLSVFKLPESQGTATTIHIGNKAYKDKNNAIIAADADSLVTGYVATSAVVNTLIPATQAPVGQGCDILGVFDLTDAVEDVVITLTCNVAAFDGDIALVYAG